MNKKLHTALLFICSLVPWNAAFGAQAKEENELNLKPGMEFKQLGSGTWGADDRTGATGWLTVPNEDKVLVQLTGKSYYDKNKKGDWRVRYIAYTTNGLPWSLPRGLYYWQKGSDDTNEGETRPAARNRYKGQLFDVDTTDCKMRWFIYKGRNKGTAWDESKEKYEHPSQAISDLLSK